MGGLLPSAWNHNSNLYFLEAGLHSRISSVAIKISVCIRFYSSNFGEEWGYSDNLFQILCLSQFQLGTSPPGNPRENFFERANPGHPGNFFCLIPCPRAKNDGRIPGGGAKFSQTRRNCSLSLQKILKKIKKTTRQYKFLFGEFNKTFIF